MVRIMLMYYVNCYKFLEEPEKYWAKMLEEEKEGSPEPTLFFDKGDELLLKNHPQRLFMSIADRISMLF